MSAGTKTRDRILATALALFNAEGEAQVSTVDIAAVLGISPGNLYYHFKGKEAIIEALFASFETELKQVLSAPIKRALSIEDHWIFVYIVFEEINDFRFFYEAAGSILERCPSLRPRFARLLTLKETTARAILTRLENEGLIGFAKGEKDRLAERLAAHLTFWIAFRRLTSKSGSQADAIHDGVYATLIQIAPYLTAGRAAYTELLAETFAQRSIAP